MNLAGGWKLPVIYVCENNQYAMTVSLAEERCDQTLVRARRSDGFEGKTIDGNDVEAVYEAAEQAAAKGRSDGGATFLECVTYRWDGHFGGDPGTGYRPKEEIEAWKQKCPIKRLKENLIREGQLSEPEFQKMSDTVYAELDEVAKRAEAAPLPKKAVDLSSIYAPTERVMVNSAAATQSPTKEMRVQEALREALRYEMARDERVFVMGEDVALFGGAYGVTRVV